MGLTREPKKGTLTVTGINLEKVLRKIENIFLTFSPRGMMSLSKTSCCLWRVWTLSRSEPRSAALRARHFLSICSLISSASLEHKRVKNIGVIMCRRRLAHREATTTITFNIILILCDILAFRLLWSRGIDIVIISILCIRKQEFKYSSRCYHCQMVELKFEPGTLTAETLR